MSHDTLVYFAKTFGLIWLMATFVVVAILAYRPSKRAEYERAARSVLPEYQAGDEAETAAAGPATGRAGNLAANRTGNRR